MRSSAGWGSPWLPPVCRRSGERGPRGGTGNAPPHCRRKKLRFARPALMGRAPAAPFLPPFPTRQAARGPLFSLLREKREWAVLGGREKRDAFGCPPEIYARLACAGRRCVDAGSPAPLPALRAWFVPCGRGPASNGLFPRLPGYPVGAIDNRPSPAASGPPGKPPGGPFPLIPGAPVNHP